LRRRWLSRALPHAQWLLPPSAASSVARRKMIRNQKSSVAADNRRHIDQGLRLVSLLSAKPEASASLSCACASRYSLARVVVASDANFRRHSAQLRFLRRWQPTIVSRRRTAMLGGHVIRDRRDGEPRLCSRVRPGKQPTVSAATPAGVEHDLDRLVENPAGLDAVPKPGLPASVRALRQRVAQRVDDVAQQSALSDPIQLHWYRLRRIARRATAVSGAAAAPCRSNVITWAAAGRSNLAPGRGSGTLHAARRQGGCSLSRRSTARAAVLDPSRSRRRSPRFCPTITAAACAAIRPSVQSAAAALAACTARRYPDLGARDLARRWRLHALRCHFLRSSVPRTAGDPRRAKPSHLLPEVARAPMTLATSPARHAEDFEQVRAAYCDTASKNRPRYMGRPHISGQSF
jgi:hypothetical protein